MNFLLEIAIKQGFLLDLLGVVGLGLVALAAIRFARKQGSTGGAIMLWGALALIIGRVGILVFSHFIAPLNQAGIDPTLLALGRHVPMVLLTAGFGSIVWGLWGHERKLSGEPITD